MNRTIRWLLATLILAGSATVPRGPAATQEAAATFLGTYTCVQGPTAAKLRIVDARDDQRLEAIFAFGPTPGNPSVPTGSFLMEGRLDRGGRAILLQPTLWLQQPRGFNMIGLIGQIDDAFRTIEGTVLHGTACTTFSLHRARR
jgi:hypothetical protein